ncbi:MAG: MBL fold metallo-hydrolase [Clostridiales bacterium]|nr:MBL fold metallo-hydrolase [Clostridiales bacterium]
MKITYIGHSGFLMEWDSCYWLFDYYTGSIPAIDPSKKLFIFVSHKHGDHFNPEIFKLYDKYPKIQYILSSDIKLKENDASNYDITDAFLTKIATVKPSQDYEFSDEKNQKIFLKTLKSTDCGVAFLLQYMGRTIYHAGDLNLWAWKEESKQYNNNMAANYQKEMNILKTYSIDLAFVPLDPRQEEWYRLGLDKLLETTKVRYVFPMHFWEKPEIIQQYKQESPYAKQAQIMGISHAGELWNLEF